MYEEADLTHFNQILDNCTIKRCWEECYKNSEFEKQKEEVENFNRLDDQITYSDIKSIIAVEVFPHCVLRASLQIQTFRF